MNKEPNQLPPAWPDNDDTSGIYNINKASRRSTIIWTIVIGIVVALAGLRYLNIL